LDAEYVALSDQDDIWLPDKLARAAMQLTNAGADGYSSNLTAFDEVGGRRWTIRKPGPVRKFDYLFQGASAGCTYVFSRSAADLIALRMRTEDTTTMVRPSHDWAFYAICRSYGLKWYFDDNYSGILYRQHENNFYGASGGQLEEFLKKWRILRSGWFREQVLYHSAFISGGWEEKAILSAMRTGRLRDRLWLISRIGQLRRERSKRLGLTILLLLALY
jgi:rhamnosyltransferase